MRVDVVRYDFSDRRTIGKLAIDGLFQCYTLEDAVRDVKIAGQTAIPAGTYRVVITESQRFKMPLPLLLDVPNFTGVRIHSGNTAADTAGCILVGLQREADTIRESHLAMGIVFDKIKKALEANDTVTLTIGGT